MPNTYEFINSQLMKVAPFPIESNSLNGAVKMKLTSAHDVTEWIELTPDQQRQIEQILLQGLTPKEAAR